MTTAWRVVCDDSVNDFECELLEEVAADFIFDMPFGKKSTVRAWFTCVSGKTYSEFKQLMYADLSDALEGFTSDEIWEMLAPHLNPEGILYRQGKPKPRKQFNPYEAKDPF